MAKKARKSKDGSRPRRQSAEFAGSMSRDDASARLEALARELRAGRLTLEGADERVDVGVADDLSVEVKARSSASGKKSSLRVSITWTSPQASEEHAVHVDSSGAGSIAAEILAAEVAAGSAPENAQAADDPNPD